MTLFRKVLWHSCQFRLLIALAIQLRDLVLRGDLVEQLLGQLERRLDGRLVESRRRSISNGDL